VLPLQYPKGQTAATLGLTGEETFDIQVGDDVRPGQEIGVTARRPDGTGFGFTAVCRIDTPVEVDYYRNGGILQTVLLRILKNG
jgi:aconitate hydratase